MKNVAIVAVTSLALVSVAVGLETARRPPPPERRSAPVEAAIAPQPETPAVPEAAPARAVVFPVEAEAAWTRTASVETGAQDAAPIRDAAPLANPPEAAGAPAPAKPAESVVSSAAETPAPAQAARVPEPPKVSEPPKSVERPKAAAPAEEPRAVKPAPVRARLAEKAPAARKTVAASARPARLVRDADPFHPVYVARWPGAPATGAFAQPVRFSGVFGGCRYRGVVSNEGYRIDSAC